MGGAVGERLRNDRARHFCDLCLTDRARGTEWAELDRDPERLGGRDCRAHVWPWVSFDERLDRELQQQHVVMVGRASPRGQSRSESCSHDSQNAEVVTDNRSAGAHHPL